ncbi:hypothetical protein Prudu_008463, partial [Prunus dulcis]
MQPCRIQRIVNRSPGYSEIANPGARFGNYAITRLWSIRPSNLGQTSRIRGIPDWQLEVVDPTGFRIDRYGSLSLTEASGTRGQTDPHEGPSRGPASSDQKGDSAEFS